MPNVHREKNCQWCGKPFRKQGKFCSQSCASSRPLSDHQKSAIAKGLQNYYETPEGSAKKRMDAAVMIANRNGVEHNQVFGDDWAVVPPTISDLSDIAEFVEGFESGESW